MEVEEEPQPNRVSNEKKIPQFDEAEIPQSIQSNDLDRSNDESSISIHNIDEEKPQVTSASTIVDGDESNEGKVSVLEEGLVESEGKGRDLEVDEIMGDNVEEKRSGFGGSLVNEQLTEQLPQLAEKEENFSSVEEALVGNEEKFFPLVEGLGEGGGEAKASVFHEVKQEIFEEKLSDFDQRVLKEEPQLLNEEEQVPSLEGGLGDNEGEAKAHVLDEVMQEGVEQKLLNFDGTCQNEHLKEELPLSDEKAEKVFSFEEAVVEKDEKDSSLEEGLGEKGVEAHVFDQVKDEGASSSQEELDRKEEKASSLKQEDEEDKLPVFEPSMSIVDEQTVGVKEELKGEGPGSAEGGEKVHPLQEALIEKDEKVSPCEEGLVEKEEAKDHILDETMQENVEQKPSDFDQKSVEKDEKVSPFRGESVDKYKEESDEEDAVEMDTDEGGPAMAAGRRTAMKQKSSRPRVSQGRRIRARSKPKEDESLCFICFDGGDLVLCDHRSCPKVYHPSCVNRDEEYFKAKGQWICGWHICSNCQKSAHYMCYTCTYSMCRGCIKEAEFVCVRGSKGFCQDCMKTVLLIEMNKRADETTDMVDFDDKTNWLSLFKDYWLELNAKLLLTIEELTRARNPMKEANVTSSDKETLSKMGVLQYKEEPLENSSSAHDDHGGRSSTRPGCHKESTSARKMLKKRSRNTSNKELQEAQVERTSSSGDIEWASKELLDFVAHMKNGDTTVLSHFDVQALLLQYIKQNNLRDPHRKSQIICDARLLSLFGKARVGHLEILKLLDPHLLIKEASPLATDENQGGVVDPDPSQMDAGGNSDASTKTTLDTRRKSRRKIEGGSGSLDEYAAIDVHNVSLLYLRRNLMESLLDDVDMFNENVIGAFVRIRISDSASNTYRLVQVVGTGKAAGKYKSGKKATDITLEILNLNKRDIITIDLISNQEFTEEECKRLRQSVKCGLIDRLTVAQVQEKARGLHTARVNDWLASEKLRLGHLRDRASEKGCRKEHRECVEKLQLLSTPEEHLRRLNEVPDIHVDPKMAPDYESTEDEEDLNSERQGKNKMVKYSFRERDEFSARRVGSASRKNSDVACDSNRSSPKAGLQDAVLRTSPPVRIDGLLRTEGNNVCQVSSPKTSKADVNANGTDNGIPKNSQPVIEPAQISCIQPQATPQPQTTNDVSPNKPSETDKMWHYQDPAGKIQGPFSMTQLRKWSSSGFFPTNLRIWRTSEKQEDSVLLTDAVSGKFHKDLQKQEPQPSDTNQPTNISQPTQPPSLSTTITASTSSTGCDSSKDFHALSGQTQVQNCPRPITPFPRNSTQQPSFQGRDGRSESNGRWNGNQGRQHNWHSNGPRRFPPSGRGYERQHPYRSSSGQRFSGEQLKAQPPANLPAHAPQPGSIDWASLQGAINRIIPSPSPPNLPSTMNSVGVHVSNAPTNVNPANTQENIGVLNNLQPQNKPLEPAAPPVTSGNHLVYSGSSTPQIVDGSNTDQASTGDHTVPSNKVDAAKMPTEVHEMQASEDKRIPASNPMGSSNLPDASASTSKSQSESQCFASVSAQEQGSNTLNVNPAQPLGMVYPAVPGATNMGWGTVAHGPMNMNWGAPANMNMGWAQPAQAIMNLNLGWAIPAQGMPVNPGWVAPVNQNPGWVGNANQNAAWGAMMPGSGQASMHNTSNQNAGDGGSSHPQPGVQKGGVCSFYKNGHCKKGASCNYLHS